MKPYDHLPIVPTVIADSIVGQEYKAQELSSDIRSDGDIAEIEAGRQKLTIEQRREFADLCEVRCQKAYAAKAPWFLKIANAKDNSGRDQLYVWIRHWMTAYIADPVVFRSHCQ